MPDTPSEEQLDKPVKPDSSDQSTPSPIAKALEGIPDPQIKAILSVALSRTSFGVGPDPETAKTLAQAEMHEEECKLKAFQANLDNRERQNQRDHEFRKKKLNHSTMTSVVVLATSVCGIGAGLYLTVAGSPTIGTPVMVAGFSILTPFAGKLLAARDKD